jgi:hypothetical protein
MLLATSLLLLSASKDELKHPCTLKRTHKHVTLQDHIHLQELCLQHFILPPRDCGSSHMHKRVQALLFPRAHSPEMKLRTALVASLTKNMGDPGEGTGAPMADRMPNMAPSLFVLPTLLRTANKALLRCRIVSCTARTIDRWSLDIVTLSTVTLVPHADTQDIFIWRCSNQSGLDIRTQDI